MPTASLPRYHVTGPVHHYVRSPAYPSRIYYLGTAETTPRVELRPSYRDIMNDVAGRTLPGQRTFDGEAAMVGTVLTRFSKEAYAAILSAGVTLAPGQEGRYSRGSLVFGVKTFELWLSFENYWNETYRTAGQTPGYYFPQAMLAAHTRDTLGTEGEKLLCAFDCQPYWLPQSSLNGVSGTERSWLLYSTDDNTVDFPADVRVPQ
jgi:hypothetical protein